MDDQHTKPGSEDSAHDAEDSTVGESGTVEDISTENMSTLSVTTGNPDDMDDQHTTPGSEDSAHDAEDSTVGEHGTAEDISTDNMSTISVMPRNPDDIEKKNSAIVLNCSRLLLLVAILILQ